MVSTDFDTALLGDFLSHLETERGNDARTRNTRLAAIHSFFRYVVLHEPRYTTHRTWPWKPSGERAPDRSASRSAALRGWLVKPRPRIRSARSTPPRRSPSTGALPLGFACPLLQPAGLGAIAIARHET